MLIDCNLMTADQPTVNNHFYTLDELKKLCDTSKKKGVNFYGRIYNYISDVSIINFEEISHKVEHTFINDYYQLRANITPLDTPSGNYLYKVDRNRLELFPIFMGTVDQYSYVKIENPIVFDIYINHLINVFKDPYGYLSNFSTHPIYINNIYFPTVEHAFQSAKTFDSSWQEKIRSDPDPRKAKKFGKKAPKRSDWEQVKYNLMFKFVQEKFNQNPSLKEKLFNTGSTTLVEGNNWHDNEWGNCYCPKCNHVAGLNYLGKILMRIREEIRKEKLGVK